MKRRIAEESALFVSVLKWAALASAVGVIVGVSTAIFLKALDLSISFTGGYSWFYLLLPVSLLASNLVADIIDKEAAGEGLDNVIDSVHNDHGRIRFTVAPAKFLASIITLAGGGSAGKEAPPVQIGGALAYTLARALNLDRSDQRKLVICAISAGFASVFGAPIAGAIFGIESLFLGQLLYDVLFPSFVAGIVSYQVTLGLGVTYFTKGFNIVPDFTGGLFFKVILGGIVFGIVSLLLVEGMKLSGAFFKKLKLSAPMKGALAGLILLGGTLAIGNQRYLGLGLNTIEDAVAGQHVPAGAFLIKIFFTAITLGAGASGGIITPIFFIGATSGNAIASFLGFDPSLFAAIGMVALLAGAANTPVAASILAMELFGVKTGPWAATAAVVSYLMVGHRSIHASQMVAALKSASVFTPLNTRVGDAHARVQVRDKSVLGAASRFYTRIWPRGR